METRSKKTIQAFRRLRESLGNLTMQQIADRLGMSKEGWEHWEYGRHRPRGIALKALLALCPDEETRALFANLSPAPAAENPKLALPPADITKEPEYVRKAPAEMRRRYRELVKIFREMEQYAREGDRGAEEALRAFAEMWSNSAYAVSSPERPRGRKALLNKKGIKDWASFLDEF